MAIIFTTDTKVTLIVPVTTIRYDLASSQQVGLHVYDVGA